MEQKRKAIFQSVNLVLTSSRYSFEHWKILLYLSVNRSKEILSLPQGEEVVLGFLVFLCVVLKVKEQATKKMFIKNKDKTLLYVNVNNKLKLIYLTSRNRNPKIFAF